MWGKCDFAFLLGRSPRASQSAVCTAAIDALFKLMSRAGGLFALPLPDPPRQGR